MCTWKICQKCPPLAHLSDEKLRSTDWSTELELLLTSARKAAIHVKTGRVTLERVKTCKWTCSVSVEGAQAIDDVQPNAGDNSASGNVGE